MFVKFETGSNVARKGFAAFIQRIGINSNDQNLLNKLQL